MKKLRLLVLLGLLLTVLSGCSYYKSTYQGKEAYAVVPEAVKMKSKNSDGSDYKKDGRQYYYYSYDFKWVLTNSTTKSVSWHSQESADPKPLIAGSYVYGQVSDKRVVEGPNPIAKDKIPSKVLDKIEP